MDQSFSVDITYINNVTIDILKQLNTVSESVRILRAENLQLKQIHDMSVVHLSHFRHDYEELQIMYRKLKESLYNTDLTSNTVNEKSPSSPKVVQKNKNNFQNPEDDIGSTLSLKEIGWKIVSQNPFYNNEHVRLKYCLSTNSVVCSVCFDFNGTYFAFCNEKTAFICDTKDGSLISQIDICIEPNYQPYSTRVIRISPNSKYLALGDAENNVLIFSIETKSLVSILKQHTNIVSSILFTNDSKRLISGGFDKLLCNWDLEKFQLINKFDHPSKDNETDEMIVSLAMDPDESMIAVGFMSGSVGIYDPSFNEPMISFKAHEEHLLDVAISPFDFSIATGSHDKSAKVWNLRGPAKCKSTFPNHQNWVLSVCFSSKTPILFTGSKDEKIRAYSYPKNEHLFEIEAHKNTLFEIAHHPTQNLFIACSGDGLVCVWEYDIEK